MANKWKEITVYVHGITPEKYVSSHTKVYREFHKMVNAELKRRKKSRMGRPVMVEWGWENSRGKDKNLAEAERIIAEASFKAYRKSLDLTLNPARPIIRKVLRPMFLYGIADMFYYISDDGKKTIRETVFTKILSALTEFSEKLSAAYEGISVTCIGHSAGTVILHDLLYNIFTRNYTKKKLPPAFFYMKRGLLSEARELAKRKKIRLRKFYTFGSPITPLTIRSDSLMEKVVSSQAKEGFLKPKDIGVVSYPGLTDPRWVNFWDPDDVISFPVEFLYDNSTGFLEDKCIDVSDNPLVAHGKYWTNRRIARYIAETY